MQTVILNGPTQRGWTLRVDSHPSTSDYDRSIEEVLGKGCDHVGEIIDGITTLYIPVVRTKVNHKYVHGCAEDGVRISENLISVESTGPWSSGP